MVIVRDSINNLYFNWMSELAIPNFEKRERYRSLLFFLNDTRFYFTIPLDENRQIDGLQLRYRFGQDRGYSNVDVRRMIDTRECSMLEMMIALALRCEENVIYDPDIQGQLSFLFFEMIRSLKLEDMTNNTFDPEWVKYRIDCLLNHEYEPNGSGGLFTIKKPRADLRTVEIWYQMCWYLDAIMKGE